jgi:hypothetical protein
MKENVFQRSWTRSTPNSKTLRNLEPPKGKEPFEYILFNISGRVKIGAIRF